MLKVGLRHDFPQLWSHVRFSIWNFDLHEAAEETRIALERGDTYTSNFPIYPIRRRAFKRRIENGLSTPPSWWITFPQMGKQINKNLGQFWKNVSEKMFYLALYDFRSGIVYMDSYRTFNGTRFQSLGIACERGLVGTSAAGYLTEELRNVAG